MMQGAALARRAVARSGAAAARDPFRTARPGAAAPRARWVAPRDSARGATAGANGLGTSSSSGSGADADLVAGSPGTIALGLEAAEEPAALAATAAAAAQDSGASGSGSGSSGAASPVGRSHPLALPEDLFAADELVQELADPSALGKRGELLLLAQALVMAFVVWPPFKLVGVFDLIATASLVAGLVFCVYGLISLGRNFSPLAAPRKNHKLVTSGLYAHCRHPLYGGLIMAALGLAAITRSEVRLALSLLLWAVLEQKAKAEEAALVARYGGDYEAYADTTKKFIPFLY